MTDEPGREPEQRLPATRPEAGPSAVERFSSPPTVREVELSPERSGRIVRASGDARFIGFLAVLVVALFAVVYYLYEVTGFGFLSAAGLPSTGRMETEFTQQQVTAVERGYNIYQANCARCHGVNGEGGIGPTLHSQEKLYQHLNPTYLAAMLTVGGRFACGDPASIMPVWSNQGFPPGPLNYKQIEDVIEFIRAPNTMTFVVRNPELFEPEVDPATGKVKTFTGWVDPTYKPAPGATPYPNCWKDSFAAPSPSAGASAAPSAGASAAPSAGASAAPSAGASEAPSGTTLQISAQNIAYDKSELEAPANTAFKIEFANNDAGVPHNVAIKDASGTEVFKGEIFNGVATKTYDVPALPAGTYTFICSVHPNMTGTLTVK